MPKKKSQKRSPKVAPFALATRKGPIAYKISPKVRALLDDPSLDSDHLGPKDRAVLVYELGKRLVADEAADFHEHYLRHANPLVAAGAKAYQWVYDALMEEVDENPAESGDNWFPALPFLLAGERDTVEDAARLICLHHPGDGKNRLIGASDVLTSMQNRAHELETKDPAARLRSAEAIAGGMAAVLFCGDLRLLDRLNQAWDEAPDAVKELLYQFFDVRITELQVELYLSILERSEAGSDDLERAALHLSSCVLPKCMPSPRHPVTVEKIFFNFGLHERRDEQETVSEVPVAKYLAKTEPRLRAQRAKAPKLIDDILANWRAA